MQKTWIGNYMVGLMLVSFVFMIGFFTLYSNQKSFFSDVEESYKSGTSCNLSKKTDPGELAKVLYEGGYIADKTNARFTAEWIVDKLKKTDIPNLGSLNKKDFSISVSEALTRGDSITVLRANSALEGVGYSDDVAAIYKKIKYNNELDCNGSNVISVRVEEVRDDDNVFSKFINKIVGKGYAPVDCVAVCLVRYIDKTLDDGLGNDISVDVKIDTLGFAFTNKKGIATFKVPDGYYSVLPIRKGYQYGLAKGTVKGKLTSDKEWRFVQRTHMIKPLDSHTYSRIKQDKALTVRTPSEYKDSLISSVVLFIMAWWSLFFFVRYSDKKIGKTSDHLILLVLMSLTGVGLLTMYSVSNPLTDLNLGGEMIKGTIWGIFILWLASLVNFIKFYNGQSRIQFKKIQFDFAAQFISWVSVPFLQKLQDAKKTKSMISGGKLWYIIKYYTVFIISLIFIPIEWFFRFLSPIFRVPIFKNVKLPEGIGYLAVALILMIMLMLFGEGPEGSDAKVNLFGFQPSEVSKYLVVVLIAAFFAKNANKIQAFSKQNTKQTFLYQLRMLVGIFLAMFLLIGMYIVLSDMGPALVVVITFIFLYSIARRDFPQLILGTISFILFLYVGSVLNNTPNTLLLFAGVWFAVWIVGWGVCKHQLYESAVLMNIVLAAFILGSDIMSQFGFEAIAQRLSNRNAMAWSGIWMNDAIGGDQVAQGIWGISSGGMFGQGLGHGNPNLIPAFNTDMILSSIGETMGWLSILLIILCLAVLLHRTLLLARRAGHPFAFYLMSGIAIATGVQFMVITLGSLGLIPLTGVSVPFLSFGKVSLIINLAAFGIVVSLSRQEATKNQQVDIRKYDNVVAAASGGFLTFAVLILCVFFYYQVWNRNTYLTKPAFVTNTEGAFVDEYNPRIYVLETKLHAGNIYDRNGMLLATSVPDSVKANIGKYLEAGIQREDIYNLLQRRMRRYYPFGDHLLFTLGDFNTGIIRDDNGLYPRGYVAEYRYLTHLRGFDNAKTNKDGTRSYIRLETKSFRVSRFLPVKKREYIFPVRDYSNPDFLSMLKSGANSNSVERWNSKRSERDLHLTVDATLQTRLQNQMEQDIANGDLGRLKKLRASVVILNAKTGEFLSSANYPMPNQSTISNHPVYEEKDKTQWAYTTQDLGTTFMTLPGSTGKVISAMAAFIKEGESADRISYNILPSEVIGHDRSGNISMLDGLRYSVNSFYVNLVHDKDLYTQMKDVGYMAGLRIHVGIPNSSRASYVPYYFSSEENLCDSVKYGKEYEYLQNKSLLLYDRYKESPPQNSSKSWMAKSEFGIAWGQHHTYATPLAMARVASIVANDGVFVPTRYAIEQNVASPKRILDRRSSAHLQRYMKAEASKHKVFPASLGGKTGTPMRPMAGEKTLVNDAWYLCYVYSKKEKAPLAIALRMERTKGYNSGKAVQFMASTILPVLRELNYGID